MEFYFCRNDLLPADLLDTLWREGFLTVMLMSDCLSTPPSHSSAEPFTYKWFSVCLSLDTMTSSNHYTDLGVVHKLCLRWWYNLLAILLLITGLIRQFVHLSTKLIWCRLAHTRVSCHCRDNCYVLFGYYYDSIIQVKRLHSQCNHTGIFVCTLSIGIILSFNIPIIGLFESPN